MIKLEIQDARENIIEKNQGVSHNEKKVVFLREQEKREQTGEKFYFLT